MSENLREQTFQAMKAAWRDRAMSVSFDVTWRAVTDAAWEVVGPELDRLRAEVANLRAAGHAVGWGHERERQRADRAEAERDDLRARLAKVEALCDDLERKPYGEQLTSSSVIRAALASVPEPSDSEPACGDSETHAPCCDACGGSGASDEASSNGLCWDCRGTGCAHEPSEPAPGADREAGERRTCWRSECRRGCAYPDVCSEPEDGAS